jgi:hypothetical protein
MRPPRALLLALGAAACNGQAGGNRTSGGERPAELSMRAGMWETQMRILSVDAPGAPSEIQAALRGSISTAPVFERSCLTPAEAANPVGAFRDRSTRENTNFTCESGESVFTGGRIRMTLTCRSNNGQPDLRQAMVGTYAADRFQAAVTGETATPATEALQSYPVRISSTLTGRRIGDCPAGAAN